MYIKGITTTRYFQINHINHTQCFSTQNHVKCHHDIKKGKEYTNRAHKLIRVCNFDLINSKELGEYVKL